MQDEIEFSARSAPDFRGTTHDLAITALSDSGRFKPGRWATSRGVSMGQPMQPFPGSQPLNPQGMRLLPENRARNIAASFDIVDLPAGFHDDPYPVYHALRMYAPVRPMASGSVLVSRHADLESIYKDTVLYSSDKTVE